MAWMLSSSMIDHRRAVARHLRIEGEAQAGEEGLRFFQVLDRQVENDLLAHDASSN
jgi:hypothetical protein